jgi:hypothetical protein
MQRPVSYRQRGHVAQLEFPPLSVSTLEGSGIEITRDRLKIDSYADVKVSAR